MGGAIGGGLVASEGELLDAAGVGEEGFRVRRERAILVRGLLQQTLSLGVVGDGVGEASAVLEGLQVVGIGGEDLAVEGEGSCVIVRGLKLGGYEEVQRHVAGGVAGDDGELVMCLRELALGDEEVGQLQADLAAAEDGVTLPGAEDGGAIVVDGLLVFVAGAGKAGELQIDEAVAGASVPEVEEVVGGFFSVTGIGESLSKEKLVGALVGGVGERGAESGDGFFRAALGEGLPPALRPENGQVCAMALKRTEEEEGDAEERERDGDEDEKGEAVMEEEFAPGTAGLPGDVSCGSHGLSIPAVRNARCYRWEGEVHLKPV